MNDPKRTVDQDWNGRPIVAVQSKGGVWALANVYDQLLKPDGIPWPPAPIVQKLYQSRQERAFAGPAKEVVTQQLGYYCDLQSVHSEDVMTWNFFGPLMAAPAPERVRFGNWLLGQLEPEGAPNHTCEIDLWRRIPHPDTLVPGGPEIDFLVVGDQCVIFGEAKWRSAEGKGQGVEGDKSQLQLRSDFLAKYGRQVYGHRRKFYVLFVTLGREESSQAAYHESFTVARLTWGDLCTYPEHPMQAEVKRYYQWKQEFSQ